MTNKTWIVMVCSAVLAVSACKKGGGGAGAAMAKMAEFKDKMCGCKDAKCAQGVTDEMTKWSQEQAKDQKGEQAKVSEEDTKKMTEITQQMTECATKAMTAGGGDTAAPPAAPAAPPAAAPPAGAAIANAADYEAKGSELMDKFTQVFTDSGTDCEKLAANVSKFFDDNKATWDAVTAYEKAHPDDKKAVEKKQEAKMKAFQDKASPALDKCKGNKALEAAMKRMPE